MNEDMKTAVTLGLALAGALGTLIGFVITLAVNAGRLAQRIDQIEARNKEDRDHDREKFTDLYNFRSEMQKITATISTALDTLIKKMDRVEEKLDEAKNDRTH